MFGTPVTSCTVITIPGEYILQNDIVNSAATRCIEIKSSDVTFDGNGHTIDGVDTTPSVGIQVYNALPLISNIIIKDVTVTDWYSGIDSYYATSVSVLQSNANSNVGWGIHIWDPDPSNCNIIGNKALNNDNMGIQLSGVSYSTISDNIAQYNSVGMAIGGGSGHNNFINNTASDNSYAGFYFTSAPYNTFVKNHAERNGFYGLTVSSDSTNNIFYDNYFSNTNNVQLPGCKYLEHFKNIGY